MATAIYPAALATATNLPTGIAGTNATAGVHANLESQQDAELLAIEAELGADVSGTFANVKTRLDALQTCRKVADQTFSTQTLANVTDMAMVLAANSSYTFEWFIPYAAGTARGIGFGLTLGGTITTLAGMCAIYGNAADGTTAIWSGIINSTGDSVTNSASATSGKQFAKIEGIAVMGATGGTMQLQAKQGNGATSATATVYTGSFGRAYLN